MAEELGRKLLGEVEVCSLENVLTDLQKLHARDRGIKPARLGIPRLDEIWRKHGGRLELSGRSLALLYHLVSRAVSPPRSGMIVVVDCDGRFDVSRLRCSQEDLKHVYVLHPTAKVGVELEAILKQVGEFSLYGEHGSKGRELVATVVNGGSGGDVCTGWKGWLRVKGRGDAVLGFGMGMSVEEGLAEREARQEAVEAGEWVAGSEWGEYRWSET